MDFAYCSSCIGKGLRAACEADLFTQVVGISFYVVQLLAPLVSEGIWPSEKAFFPADLGQFFG